MKTYTKMDLDAAIVDYAVRHEVETDDVLIDRNYYDGLVIGFRLSLDVDGRSRGGDETFGNWRDAPPAEADIVSESADLYRDFPDESDLPF